MKIKWTRLKNISEQIIGVGSVKLTLTTAQELDELNACVSFNESEIHIILNANVCKSLTMVIKAVAHELTHVVLDTIKHNEDFNKKWNDISKRIHEEYKKSS